MAHGGLDMAETVTAEMLATVPAGDHHDMVFHAFPLQHANDDHAGSAFPVIILDRSVIRQQDGPTVVGCLEEFLLAAQRLDKGFGLVGRTAGATGHRVF